MAAPSCRADSQEKLSHPESTGVKSVRGTTQRGVQFLRTSCGWLCCRDRPWYYGGLEPDLRKCVPIGSTSATGMTGFLAAAQTKRGRFYSCTQRRKCMQRHSRRRHGRRVRSTLRASSRCSISRCSWNGRSLSSRIAYCAPRSDASGFSHTSMRSGLIGMMQRSCPAAAISRGGSSVIAANKNISGSPAPDQCDQRHATSML
ncbi:hypothetical protein OKW46_003405 [Paraburkholderia sp. WSM4179]|nr:hypothetical protein [Paraburkholderia sp. WSM4179]